MGKQRAALRDYLSVVDLEPLNTTALHKSADISFNLPDHPRLPLVLKNLTHASKLLPENLKIKNDLGYAYYLQGHYDLARGVFLALSEVDATKEDPVFHSAVLSNLAYSLAETGHVGKAVEMLRESIKLDPKIFQARIKLAKILGSKRFGQTEEAMKILEALVSEGYNDASIHSALGRIAFESENLNEAASWFVKSISSEQSNPKHHASLANTYTQMDRNFKAASHYFRAFWLSRGAENRVYHLLSMLVALAVGMRIVKQDK